MTSTFLQLNPQKASPRALSCLSLSNIPNVQPEVQIFSATALEWQSPRGTGGNVNIWATVRKLLQIRSLQLL